MSSSEMHQTKKGDTWHFGMKAHIGVDVASGLVHTVVGTAANEADVTQTAKLLHGEEEAAGACRARHLLEYRD
jgi:IS5 family transposase